MSVLIDSSIKARFKEIFPLGGDTENIRAAKYYLTLGEDLLFLPGGDEYPAGQRRKRSFTLSPGQSAVVSTEERVHMPNDLVGIIGSRFENSDRGLLFFGGMIVDPGYGRGDDDASEESPGERLILTIANVGNRAIELRPGEDFIASIAFLKLEKEVSKASLEKYFVAQPAVDLGNEIDLADSFERPFRPLGFVEELEKVKVRLDKVHASTTQVVLRRHRPFGDAVRRDRRSNLCRKRALRGEGIARSLLGAHPRGGVRRGDPGDGTLLCVARSCGLEERVEPHHHPQAIRRLGDFGP